MRAGALSPAGIDQALSRSPFPAVGIVAGREEILYQGAAGGARVDSVFRIYSMTKPVTTAAALQLVAEGVLRLDEPAANHVPSLAQNLVLDVAADGSPRLRPPASPVTVRQLLNHTSGFAYEIWNARLRDYLSAGGSGKLSAPGDEFLRAPLTFDPGARWEYGTSTDVLGRVIENASGLSLAEYFRRRIFDPLRMDDTAYSPTAADPQRLVPVLERTAGGLAVSPRLSHARPFWTRGGAGLYSTAADYVRFLQVLLNAGCSPSGRLLSPQAVTWMSCNQIGEFWAGILPTAQPALSADLEIVPRARGKFSFGFFLNAEPVEGGRAAGSMAWAGLLNTFFWVDPHSGICAVLLMQVKPFLDPEAAALLHSFERAVYASMRTPC